MIPARKLAKPPPDTIPLHDRAMDNLRFIRETMERSASFTAVSGSGGVVMGLIALAAAGVSTRVVTPLGWLVTWMGAAGLAFAVALGAMAYKARAAGLPLLSGPGRKFAWNVTPPLLAGALLTLALFRVGELQLLPGVWLLLYGTGVVAGGAVSVRIVPLMGFSFMVFGAAALFAPLSWAGPVMAVGFGGLHIVFGLIIWRKHGG